MKNHITIKLYEIKRYSSRVKLLLIHGTRMIIRNPVYVSVNDIPFKCLTVRSV